MSAALFVLLLSVAGTKNALAQTQVATLQHGDDISVFYGTDAFVQAHTAAVDGDIVTLSSGSFTTPTTIGKAITLRGAGCVADTVAGTNPTILAGTVTFNVPNDSVALNVEGILFSTEMRYGKLVNPKFNRCSFQTITYYTSSYVMTNAQFVNCMIKNFKFSYTNNTTFINSVVWIPTALSNSESSNTITILLYNSLFGKLQTNNAIGVSAYNSIIFASNSSSNCNYSTQNTFINCIGIKVGGNTNNTPFGSAYTAGCTTYTSYEDVFESFTGTFSLEEPFILKDEIATGFLGSDGTQVGIYGGFMPYSNRPSYMVLRRCNVANRSTIDGKLSVEIEVVSEE